MSKQAKSEYINEEPSVMGSKGKEGPRKERSAQKTRGRGQTKAKPRLGLIFWPVFFILICGLFMLNRDNIHRTLEKTQFLKKLAGRNGTEPPPAVKIIPDFPVAPESSDLLPSTPSPQPQDGVVQSAPIRTDIPDPAPQTALPNEQPKPEAGSEDQVGNTGIEAVPTTAPAAALPAKPEEMRDRALYYIQIDRGDGTILSIKVLRKLPASDSPLLDALESLLQGPSEEERNRGLISLIPENAAILDARVLGKTAYISFSEDFQYNQYGAEGYIAQLRQIVWTATEFPTVEDVQFLIEGRRVDYLGESIRIGAPLSREALQ